MRVQVQRGAEGLPQPALLAQRRAEDPEGAVRRRQHGLDGGVDLLSSFRNVPPLVQQNAGRRLAPDDARGREGLDEAAVGELQGLPGRAEDGVVQLLVPGHEPQDLLHEGVRLTLGSADEDDPGAGLGHGLPHAQGRLGDVLAALATGETEGPSRGQAAESHGELVVHELQAHDLPAEEIQAVEAGPGVHALPILGRRQGVDHEGLQGGEEGLVDLLGIHAPAGEAEELAVVEEAAFRGGPTLLPQEHAEAGGDIVPRGALRLGPLQAHPGRLLPDGVLGRREPLGDPLQSLLAQVELPEDLLVFLGPDTGLRGHGVSSPSLSNIQHDAASLDERHHADVRIWGEPGVEARWPMGSVERKWTYVACPEGVTVRVSEARRHAPRHGVRQVR